MHVEGQDEHGFTPKQTAELGSVGRAVDVWRMSLERRNKSSVNPDICLSADAGELRRAASQCRLSPQSKADMAITRWYVRLTRRKAKTSLGGFDLHLSVLHLEKSAERAGTNEVTIATSGGVAPARHQNASDARHVVARVERVRVPPR